MKPIKKGNTILIGAASASAISLIFFVVSLFVQPPHWTGPVLGAMASPADGLSVLVAKDAAYRNTMAKVFYASGLLSLVGATLAFRYKRHTFVWPALLVALAASALAYGATRGHQWLFQFAVNRPWQVWQIALAVGLSAAVAGLSLWLLQRQAQGSCIGHRDVG
jgi:hypothetical protein